MATEDVLENSTDIYVRAFIVAFVLPFFYSSPDWNYANWHISIIILFIAFSVSFTITKVQSRMFVIALIMLPVIFVLTMIGSSMGLDIGSGLQAAIFYSLILGLLSIMIAFVWPKDPDPKSADRFSSGDEVVLVIGHTNPIGESENIQELTTPALVLELDEVRVKLRHRDLGGRTVESWHPIDSIRPVGDASDALRQGEP